MAPSLCILCWPSTPWYSFQSHTSFGQRKRKRSSAIPKTSPALSRAWKRQASSIRTRHEKRPTIVSCKKGNGGLTVFVNFGRVFIHSSHLLNHKTSLKKWKNIWTFMVIHSVIRIKLIWITYSFQDMYHKLISLWYILRNSCKDENFSWKEYSQYIHWFFQLSLLLIISRICLYLYYSL